MIQVEMHDDGQLAAIEAELRTANRTMLYRGAQVTRAWGLRLEASAKRRAPVDTGLLRSSISASAVQRGPESVSIVVDASASYAGYVEHGTSRQAPQPFLGPALEEVGPQYEAAIAQISDPLEGAVIAFRHGRVAR